MDERLDTIDRRLDGINSKVDKGFADLNDKLDGILATANARELAQAHEEGRQEERQSARDRWFPNLPTVIQAVAALAMVAIVVWQATH